MFFFRVIRNIFNIEELRNKLLYSVFALAVFRLGAHIPLTGINLDVLTALQNALPKEGFLSYINMISGGALTQCSIFALGIAPYITASIMMQFLTMSFPFLEELSKDGGEAGRATINQYTRYLAMLICVVQATTLVVFGIERGFNVALASDLVLESSWLFRFKAIISLTMGSMFVMWLGEQISKHGMNQGASLIIFASIVCGIPKGLLFLANNFMQGELSELLIGAVAAFLLGLTVLIIFLEKGERRVPINYARKMVGRRLVGGISSYIPFKFNPSGIMPIILAQPAIAILTSSYKSLVTRFLPDTFLVGLLDYNTLGHIILTVALIVWFNFAYTSLIFDPVELAERMRKEGGFIPGIRPGSKTAEFFEYLLNRINTPGSIYMAVLAVAPSLILAMMSSPITFSGLSILIAVGVALDMSSQIEAYLVESRYEGFIENKTKRFRLA